MLFYASWEHSAAPWAAKASRRPRCKPPSLPRPPSLPPRPAQADIQQEGECAAPEAAEEPDTRQHSPECSTDGGAGAPPHPGFRVAAAAAVPEDGADQPDSSAQPAPRAGRGGKQEPGRHLLRHALTADVLAAAAAEFGSDKSAAGHKIYALK